MGRAQRCDVGIDVSGVTVDMKRVKARKDAIVHQSIRFLSDWLGGTKGLELVIGHARFEGPRTIRVGDHVFEAERVFINAGARARVPDLPGLKEGPFLTNSSIMDVEAVPDHLVILGGSYVALEFAQIYRRFGARVTVVERGPRLLGRDDEDVSQEIRRILELEGIVVHVGARAVRVERSGGGLVLVTDTARIGGSHLLVAVGRVPNTDDLGVEHAGIELDEHGYIRVDNELRTSAADVWAVGDCNGHGAFTHTS